MKAEKMYTMFDVHLQWFAAEDEGRTEEPTEQKIKKAREDGKVAKSADLTSSLVLLFGIIAIAVLSSYMVNVLGDMMEFFLVRSTSIDITSDNSVFPAFYTFFLKLVIPIAAVSFLIAFFGNVLQVGFLFSVKPITPDFKKIVPNFPKFFKRAFFSGEAAFNLLKAVVKVLIIGLIAFFNISGEIDRISAFTQIPLIMAVKVIAGIAFKIMLEAALAMLAFSLPDYFFQKKQHIESLKMTKQEVKEERKMADGDPLVKSRLKERMRELLKQSMLQNVPSADVVVTNPTHFAVAMEWNRETMLAPMMIAKGQDNMAFKIRQIAEDNNVPVIENKPLARALYKDVEIGDVIPEQYYEVLAVLLAEVYRMTGRVEEAV